jgi:hypothetical protein
LLGGVPNPGWGYRAYGKVRPWASSSGRKGGASHGKRHDEKDEDDKAEKAKKTKKAEYPY